MCKLFFHFGKSENVLKSKIFLNWTCLNPKTTVLNWGVYTNKEIIGKTTQHLIEANWNSKRWFTNLLRKCENSFRKNVLSDWVNRLSNSWNINFKSLSQAGNSSTKVMVKRSNDDATFLTTYYMLFIIQVKWYKKVSM